MAANSSGYLDLPELCWQIRTLKDFNNNGLNQTNGSIAGDLSPEVNQKNPGSIIDGILLEGLNYTKNINVTLEFILKEFEHFTEWYLITVVAAVGIASNVAVMVLLGRDRAMRSLAYLLHMLLLGMEVIYLTAVITFIQVRHFYFIDQHRQMRLMSYVTTVMSLSQCLSIWLLYIVATDSYRAVRLHQKPSKIRQLSHAKYNIILVFFVAILFHVPFVPAIRLLIYQLDPVGFDPCNVPVEEHWDFKSPSSEHDLYYILYYSLAYSFLLFWIPFLVIAARDKDVIDLLHSVISYSTFNKPEVIHACYSAKLVAIFCNITLICLSPKLVLLLFQMVNYAVDFIGSAQIFFEFFNVMANLLLVLKASVYLMMFLMFHPRVKAIICAACCRGCCVSCKRGKTSIEVNGEGQNIPMVLITDTEDHTEIT